MMQKKMYLSVLLLFCLFFVNAQNKLGDEPATINSSSLLELQSTNKGLRLPRIALTDLKTWLPLTGSATSGMVVYSEKGKLPEGLYYWRTDSAKWGRVIDSLMITKVVSKSLKPTGLISPTSYYQASSGSIGFPSSSTSYTGDGSITYSANEAIRLVYTVKGARIGYPVSVMTSSTFNDNIVLGKAKVVADDTVEVVTINAVESNVTPADLKISFSYTMLDNN
jgi:hypothetical protein